MYYIEVERAVCDVGREVYVYYTVLVLYMCI